MKSVKRERKERPMRGNYSERKRGVNNKEPRDRREGWKQKYKDRKEGRKERRRWVSAKMEAP